MPTESDALSYRRRYRGLIGIKSKMPIRDTHVLSRIYTPGVGAICREIDRNPLASFEYTCRGNSIALITDGSQVYEYGNIGALAALPKLEAKSVLYKTFANVDAVPIALTTQDADEIVEIVRTLAPSFGGFCLESIAAPKCFTIESRIRKAVRTAVLHHESHAAGIIVLAAVINALKVVGKNLAEARIVISGAGAAGIGVAKGLIVAGNNNIILCDRHGALHVYRLVGMNWAKSEIARLVRPQDFKGSLAHALKGADVFIGLSAGGLATREMIAGMAPDPIVFALALPTPEINEAEAKAGGAAVVATGLSDSENQIRSSLVTPGFFRGCLDVGANRVNIDMYLAAARALADMIPAANISATNIIPRQMDWRISPVIARAVAQAAQETGVASLGPEKVSPDWVYERTERYIYEGERAWLPTQGQDYGKLSINEESLELHRRYQGCVQIYTKVPVKDEVIYSRFTPRPRWPRSARRFCMNPWRPTTSPARTTWWPSSPTAAPSWAWATSAPGPPCRSWKARPCSSRPSAGSRPFPSASAPRRPTTWCGWWRTSRRRSAASTWRTSPPPAASKSSSACGTAWISRCFTTTSTAPRW